MRPARKRRASCSVSLLPSHQRILDCAAGPSSFTAEMSRLGHLVVAADPLYRFSKDAIKARIEQSRGPMLAGLRAAAGRFVWDDYGTPEALEATRLSAMKHFLEDYEEGLAEGRYLEAALPDLPFEDEAFDLALSSHFLFLYSAQFDLDFHLASVLELCRVAREVRIFPLLDLQGERSRHLAPLLDTLAPHGLATEIRKVGYEFQKGGNEMLLIRREAPS
jgi:SAM-dependent methyltransferase